MALTMVAVPVQWRMDCPHCGRFLAATEHWPGIIRVYCKQCRSWVELTPEPLRHPAIEPTDRPA